jgi:anthranilate phosphoribosyltransferase
MHYAPLIRELARGHDLAAADAQRLFAAILDGGVPDLELGALLLALRTKGESASELLGFHAATAERVHRLVPPATTDVRTVVLPTYGGAAAQPNLTALVALLLQRLGVPVLLHGALEGHGGIATAYVLRELGVFPCATLGQAQGALDRERLAFVPAAVIAPGLASLLALRARLGVRTSAQLVAKLIDPIAGHGLRVIGIGAPEMLPAVRDLLVASGERAVVFQGVGGEPFVEPRHRPRIDLIDDGHAEQLFEEEHAALDAAQGVPAGRDARTTARYVQRVLEGAAPVPLAIVNQIACCLYGAGVTADLAGAKARAAVQTHSLATA